MSSKCLQDVFKTSCKNVFKTSSRRLQDVLQRYLQDVFKTYHQVKLFLLTNLRDVFNTFLRRTAKTVIYRRICLGHTSEKFMVSVQNLQEWKQFSQFLVVHFTTPFIGVFKTWLNIYKGTFFAKILHCFKLLTILAKKALSQMFNLVGNRLLNEGLKYWAHSSSQPLN